jgi:antitoxin PrlF
MLIKVSVWGIHGSKPSGRKGVTDPSMAVITTLVDEKISNIRFFRNFYIPFAIIYHLRDMTTRKRPKEGLEDSDEYSVEAIVTVDDRGQMVLPKAIRLSMGLNPGDKVALVTLERNGKVCCVNMFKASDLANTARDIVTDKERN